MLSPSMEDYLKVIFRLSQEDSRPRVSEIAEAVRVRKPSVSKALRRLAEAGYVEHVPYGEVTLTESGERVARWQVHSFEVVADFLQSVLGIDRARAEDEAGRIEHSAGTITVDRLEALLKYVRSASPEHRSWLLQFAERVAAESTELSSEGPRYDERAWSSSV